MKFFSAFKILIAKLAGFNKKFVYPEINDSLLRKFIEEADISILDVGARGGPYPLLEILAPYSKITLCEPDKNEAAHIRSELAKKWKSITMINSALGTGSLSNKLNIARHPGLSSLMLPDLDVVRKYFPSNPSKPESRESWEIVSNEDVSVKSLDQAMSEVSESWDLIKLDTQGSELDILKSGREALKRALVIYIESEFVPFYEQQPLFGDVHSYLTSNGFRLIDLKRTFLRRADAKDNTFSKREIAWAHSMYIREKRADGTDLKQTEKNKLICLLSAFWFFDLAKSLTGDNEISQSLERYSQQVFVANRKKLMLRTRRNIFGRGWQDQVLEP